MKSSEPKRSTDLDLAELQALGQRAWSEAKQAMHAAGIPTNKVVDEKVYHEFPDGHLELVEDLAVESSVPDPVYKQ